MLQKENCSLFRFFQKNDDNFNFFQASWKVPIKITMNTKQLESAN